MNRFLKLFFLLCVVIIVSCNKDTIDNINSKILFITRNIDEKYDLKLYMYLMNTDGSEITRLLDLPVFDRKPSVSNSYNMVAFICENQDEDSSFNNLYIVNLNGDGLRIIDRSNSRYDGSPSWSQDDSKIIFSKTMSESPYYTSIFIFDFENGQENQLTNFGNCYDSNFSPDGKIISFICEFKLYFIDLDGSNKRLIVQNIVWNYCWSPNGDKIVYSGKDENNSEQIYLVDLKGNNIKKLTDRYFINPDSFWDNFGNRRPQWTPDGNKIVYESEVNEDTAEVWIMDIDGMNKARISNDGAGDRWPIVSPNGKQILFLSDLYCEGCYEIKIMDINGENQKSLSENRFTDNYPAFIEY
jgi:Tol biopolymer transport system component